MEYENSMRRGDGVNKTHQSAATFEHPPEIGPGVTDAASEQ